MNAIPDLSEIKVEEVRYTLKKFDGDYTAEQIDAGEAGEPAEVIVVEHDQIIEHTKNGEDMLREGGNS